MGDCLVPCLEGRVREQLVLSDVVGELYATWGARLWQIEGSHSCDAGCSPSIEDTYGLCLATLGDAG